MKRGTLTWLEFGGAAVAAGIGAYAVNRYVHRPLGDKLKVGDVVQIPVGHLTLATAQPINLAALASIGADAEVQVTSFQPNTDLVNGTAGRNVNLVVPVVFRRSDVRSATRDGKAFT